MAIGGLNGVKLIGPGTEAPWIDLKLKPGTTDQTETLGFKQTMWNVLTLQHFFMSPNLPWFIGTLLVYVYAPYDIEEAKNGSAVAWLQSRFTLNFIIAFLYYGFFFAGLYIVKWGKRKFSAESWPTVGNMMHNLYYWTLGVVQWTFWEYAMSRIWALNRGAGFATNADILADPKLLAWNVLWVLVIPCWRDLHFYIAHRFIHIRAIYRFVHSLHHRNMDPEPFSGMTMHPIEHLYYFSNAFTPSLYLSGLSPLIFMWNFFHLTIAPGAGHSGFEDNFQADQYHYVHHAKFECNYGSPFSAFIDIYFGTFREKIGESKMYTGEATDAVLSSVELEKKELKKNKAWGPKSYLGLPASTADGCYSAFWVALFALLGWAAILNHKEGGGLTHAMVMNQPLHIVVAAAVAYMPVAMAMLLCYVFKDRMSWRWPFQKEPLFGTFGLFVVLGWMACILPVYHATAAVCEGI